MPRHEHSTPQVAAGATQYYLTTQELPELRGGGEQLVGPPLTRLGGCFPLRPPLLPSLIPQVGACHA